MNNRFITSAIINIMKKRNKDSGPPPQIRKSDRQKQVGFWNDGVSKSVPVYVIGDRSEDYSNTSNVHDEVKQLGKTILISNMVVIGFTTLVSFGLCIGAVKRSTRLCWVWIVMTIIGICFAIIITVSTTGMMAQDQDNASSSRNTVILCITIAIQLYFLWVVFAFIQQVKQVGQGETNNNVELGGQPGEGAQPMYVPYAYQPQYPSQQASIAQSNNQ
ncbi:unnamed protein product [Orchesella dallaii]|uniref:Uncharacterized protein n=1 Tax=Orchesella dallaii TaxID=48710 RepID=A0ABP1QK67_9HEXA